MQIESYKHWNTIPDDLFSSMVQTQIECWWQEPFWEYMICENTQCRKIVSIELAEEIKDWSKISCPCCSGGMKKIYEYSEFYDILKEYFNWKVSAILLLNEWESNKEILWFWSLSLTNIEGVVDLELATRPSSFHPATLKELLATHLFPGGIEDDNIVCCHQIYIAERIRTIALFWEMQTALMQTNPEYSDMPVVLETRFDSRLYPILRSVWFEDLTYDQYWYVVQYFPRFWDLIAYVEEKKYLDMPVSSLRRYRKHALKILNEHPEFNDKYYIWY